MVEIIKFGANYNAGLFEFLEASAETILSLSDMELVPRMVSMVMAINAKS